VLIIPIGVCLCSDSVGVALAAIAALIIPVVAIIPIFGFIGAVPILGLFFVYVVRRGVLSADAGRNDLIQCPS
jgi:hypothetical protein